MFVQNYICQPIFLSIFIDFLFEESNQMRGRMIQVSTLSNSQSCEQIKKYFKLTYIFSYFLNFDTYTMRMVLEEPAPLRHPVMQTTD